MKWDPTTAQFYFPSGVPLPGVDLREWSRHSIEAAFSEVNSLASRLYNGNINILAWQAEMREQIKKEYIRQYMVGIGGRDRMDFTHWGRLGGRLRWEYQHLDRFAGDILAKDLTEKQIQARARMYMENTRWGFERALKEASITAEYTHVAWVLGYTEHCFVCLDRAGDGLQLIADNPWGGDVPPAGCLGYTHCGCHLEYFRQGEVEL